MTDEQTAVLIREVLNARRPMAAPADLRSRVLAIPDSVTQRDVRGRFARQVVSVAGAAVVGTLLLIGGYAVLMGLQISGQHGSQIPTPTPQFDPSIDGPGIVHGDVNMWLGYVPTLIAFLVSAVLIVVAFRRDKPREKRLAGLASILLLAGASLISNQPGPVFGHAWGPGEAIEMQGAPIGSSNDDTYYVTAGPGENFSVTFNVRNDGSLPVRLLGVQEVSDEESFGPRWTSVGVGFDPHFAGSIDEMTSFQPFDIAPGADVDLYMTGRAGKCAAGSRLAESAYVSREVTLAYSVLGMPWTSDLDLPFEILEAQREPCV